MIGKYVGEKMVGLEERWWKYDEEFERTVLVTQRRWKILAVHGWKPVGLNAVRLIKHDLYWR